MENYSFFNIPSTSIIIPCYSEALEFDWDATSKYKPKCMWREEGGGRREGREE
jgi:hypothetical protein